MSSLHCRLPPPPQPVPTRTGGGTGKEGVKGSQRLRDGLQALPGDGDSLGFNPSCPALPSDTQELFAPLTWTPVFSPQ